MVASYSFSRSDKKRTRRVAFPTQQINTPVANGSRVPACPTLLVPAARLTRATTSCDVMPSGLSMTKQPKEGISSVEEDGDKKFGVSSSGFRVQRTGFISYLQKNPNDESMNSLINLNKEPETLNPKP